MFCAATDDPDAGSEAANIPADDGSILPQLGSVAQQSGEHVAQIVLADIEGEKHEPFYIRPGHCSAALLDPKNINTPRIHWHGAQSRG